MERILIVEDDTDISDLIQMNLNMVGYDTKQVYDGKNALEYIEKENFDLIILDVMLPEIDGFGVMERIKHTNLPVIFLTAKNSISDRVKGLKIGADDYIVKPFECIELLARIESVLRRYGRKNDHVLLKDLEISLDERVVKKSGKVIDLACKEFELLKLLIVNKGMSLTREIILERVWGFDYLGETRTVDMHIQKIRKKLDLFDEIKTIYKIGYRLENLD
ncbi:response regulator transcription factor [Tepidibacter aestuarii]|uniref:response regulator transcription factor n=1 Tax=Tepidibacter aestuarii TaxID=2925782 RepID=UPI00211324A2|nr:response regulator transcription factor [Tepidibacter aestuarii]CAH2212384.1 Transcriptional regulatory protein WalR [Tepidibacter aestuarii]